MTPVELFSHHAIVAVDSNVLIYLLEGSGSPADAAEAIVDGIDEGAAAGELATIALTEILSSPAALGEGELFERYADGLHSVPNLRIVAVDTDTTVDAAWGRSGGHDLAMPCTWPRPDERARAASWRTMHG